MVDGERPPPDPTPIPEPAQPSSNPELAISALLVEYTSLRQESLTAIAHQIQIVNFTFAAASLAIAGVVASDISAAKIAAVCLTAIPLLTFSAAFMWLGEHHRSRRAGRGMIEIERSINRFLGENLVIWETELARRRSNDERRTRWRRLLSTVFRGRSTEPRGGHMTYPYLAAVIVIVGAGMLSQLFGLLLLSRHLHWWNRASNIFSIALGLSFLFDFLLLRKWVEKWDEVSRPDEVLIFENDDEGFRRWLIEHPAGFYLNAARLPTSDEVLLHRVGCPHVGKAERGDVHWTHEYIKICSMSTIELEAWARSEAGKEVRHCGTCG
jgi:hypothetical protein